jgi:hypothetical protein
MKFWILWGWDAVIAAIFIYFFAAGLADGSVSSFNMGLWPAVLGILAIVMLGSVLLQRSNRLALAVTLLLVLAIPGLLFALLFGSIIVLQPDFK